MSNTVFLKPSRRKLMVGDVVKTANGKVVRIRVVYPSGSADAVEIVPEATIH